MPSDRKGEGFVSAALIEEFDAFLHERGLSFKGVVVGAVCLILADVVARPTDDCDILDPEIPEDVKQASVDFAKGKWERGSDLIENWFNNGPESLKRTLPEDWQSKLEPLYQGKALRLFSLDRLTLLKTKLFAFCDREADKEDCLALNPTHEELDSARAWVQYQDANPMWPKHVDNQFQLLANELGLNKSDKDDK